MSRSYRLLRRASLAVALVAFAACGKGDPGPAASPSAVVRAAPDVTLATTRALVTSTGPYVQAKGRVAFASGADTMTLAGRDTRNVPWGVDQPAAALDLLRGVVDIYAYGGAQVQGAGTKRYQVDLDLAKAIAATPASRRADLELLTGKIGDDGTVWGDVFIDSAGRVRRILLPVKLESQRPYGDSKLIPQMVSVDFYGFGEGS